MAKNPILGGHLRRSREISAASEETEVAGRANELKASVADRTTALAGATAGAVADPTTALMKMKSAVAKPLVLISLLAVARCLSAWPLASSRAALTG